MPRTPVHLSQADHNERFFHSFDRNIYSDWAMTALFYASLHYVDAFLAHVGIENPGGHATRDCFVNSWTELRPINREYFRLKNRSTSARYYARRFPTREIDRALNNDLENVRQHIRGLIS